MVLQFEKKILDIVLCWELLSHIKPKPEEIINTIDENCKENNKVIYFKIVAMFIKYATNYEK